MTKDRRIAAIPTPMPVGLRSVNAYLVPLEAGGHMLVDGGIDSDDAWVALDRGVRAATAWSDVRVHFATHMHQDHIGLNARVRRASGAPLLMSEMDAARMAHAAAHPEEEAKYREMLLRSSGVPAEIIDRAISHSTSGSVAPFVPADRRLDGRDIILEEAPEWRAILTAGHTAGHMGLYRERDSTLLSGDAVLPGIIPTIGVNRQRPDPVRDHLESLDRLLALRPAEILPGHGSPLPGGARIGESRLALTHDSERILALVEAPQTAWEINVRAQAGRGLRIRALLHELRGTLAHLERHLLEGSLTVEENGGVRRFARKGVEN